MDIEFHYYINLLVAIYSGFKLEEARIIAFSAQYVDNNTSPYIVYNSSSIHEGFYLSQVTQSMDITMDIEEMKKIYLPYHFLPGRYKHAAKLRKQQIQNPLCTTPNNFIARTLLNRALKSKNLYWIGIASHAFSDSWAHQNFVGLPDSFNIISRLFYHLMPYLPKKRLPVGHMDVADKPDIVGEIWDDSRLKDSIIHNNERFLQSAKALLKNYSKHLGTEFLQNWFELSKYLKEVLICDSLEERFSLYQEKIQEISKEEMKKYDETDWRDSAIRGSKNTYQEQKACSLRSNPKNIPVRFWISNDEYKSSHWYQFQEAAKEHHCHAWPLIERRFTNYSAITIN